MQVKQNVPVGQMWPEGCQFINYISQLCLVTNDPHCLEVICQSWVCGGSAPYVIFTWGCRMR